MMCLEKLYDYCRQHFSSTIYNSVIQRLIMSKVHYFPIILFSYTKQLPNTIWKKNKENKKAPKVEFRGSF